MIESVPRTSQEVRTVLARAGISLRKSLGQHYLVDPNLRTALVKDAEVQPGEIILEVGVGLGILTAGLLERGAVVLGVELDETVLGVTRRLLAPYLAAEDTASTEPEPERVVARLLEAREADEPRVHLMQANVLRRKQLDTHVRTWLDALRAAAPEARLRLVANLPFQIASPLLVSILEWRPARGSAPGDGGAGFDGVAVMVQWEVAQSITAEPGSEMYGTLSVLCQAHATWDVTRRIRPTVFMPRPKVDSGFVRGTTREADSPFPLGLSASEYATFKQLVHAAFQYRRKHLRKALALGTTFPSDAVDAALAVAGLDATSRGEVASAESFATLARTLTARP